MHGTAYIYSKPITSATEEARGNSPSIKHRCYILDFDDASSLQFKDIDCAVSAMHGNKRYWYPEYLLLGQRAVRNGLLTIYETL